MKTRLKDVGGIKQKIKNTLILLDNSLTRIVCKHALSLCNPMRYTILSKYRNNLIHHQ